MTRKGAYAPFFYIKKSSCVDILFKIKYLYTSLISGRLAQLGERYPYKVDVGGSIPSTPTTFLMLNFFVMLSKRFS